MFFDKLTINCLEIKVRKKTNISCFVLMAYNYRVAPHAGAWIETADMILSSLFCCVAPHAGAWIETGYVYQRHWFHLVAPHAGAWIETYNRLPLDVRCCVAPHAGAWIETRVILLTYPSKNVAPHAGAWIETSRLTVYRRFFSSLPMRERGLKQFVLK